MTTVINNPASFREEARFQGACALLGDGKCSKGNGWHAHHVYPKQRLALDRKHDPRNALRLCTQHHMQFEWAGPGKPQIPTDRLTDDNICFIWDVLREAGQDFLTRSHTGPDARFERHQRGVCHLCQH